MKQPSLHHRHTLRTFIVAVIMILANATAALAQSTFSGGDGTAEDPYQIASVDDLLQLATDVNSGTTYEDTYFKVMNDIDFNQATDESLRPTAAWNVESTQSNFTPIGGRNGNTIHKFQGHFNGGGNTISGVRIYNAVKSANNGGHQGLFGYIGSDAEVKGITLTNARITGHSFCGGIMGRNDANTTVSDCHVTNTVAIHTIVDGADYHGGIIGFNYQGTVKECTSAATLTIGSTNFTSCENYGGIVGFNNGTLTDNIADGANVPAASNEHRHGAIAGGGYTSAMQRNYYLNCTVAGLANATGVGIQGADATANGAAVSIHTLMLTDGISTTTNPNITISGTGYYAQGTVLALDNGHDPASIPMGYTYPYIVNGESVFATDNTIAMPAANTTIGFGDLVVIPWTGSGTSADDPYVIIYPSQLDLLAANVNGGNWYTNAYFQLGNDINYTYTNAWNVESDENNYTPIGTRNRGFRGHFDGKGYTIRGIRINTTTSSGIFGRIENEAEVKGITLDDACITGTGFCGGIVGDQSSSIGVSYCTVTNHVAIHIVSTNATDCGGIVGYNGNKGTVSHCVSSVHITAANGVTPSFCGGIAGRNYATLTDNLVIGAVIPNAQYSSHAAIAAMYNSEATKCHYARNYYHDCTVAGTANATNVGIASIISQTKTNIGDLNDDANPDGALPVYKLTLADGNTASPITVTYSGVNYCSQGKSINLKFQQPSTYQGYIYENYTVNGTAISSTSFTMPAYDVNVSITTTTTSVYQLTLADGITATGIVAIAYGDNKYYKEGTIISLGLSDEHSVNEFPVYSVNGKKISGNCFAMPAAAVLVNVTINTVEWTGDGTESSPYLIQCCDHLRLLARRVNTGAEDVNGIRYGDNTKWYKLDADLQFDYTDLPDTESNFDAISNEFSGHFLGQGHTISGIRIRQSSKREQGLFGYTGDAVISGIILADADITGGSDTGGIVGYNSGFVSDCHVKNDVIIRITEKDVFNHGGIVGYNSESTSGCTSAATLTIENGATGCGNFGGIVGGNHGTISDNLAIGVRLPLNVATGAIVGDVTYGELLHNYYSDCTLDNGFSAMGCHGSDVADNDGAVPAIALFDNGTTNATTIATNNDPDSEQTLNVILYGRTLYKDGSWNTLCLPFKIGDINEMDDESDQYLCLLHGATLMTLDKSNTGYDSSTGTLTLDFVDTNHIDAGVPYIIKWDKPDGYDANPAAYDIKNPVFSNVTLAYISDYSGTAAEKCQAFLNDRATTSSDGCVTFRGTFDSEAIYASPATNLYVGTDNTLYYPLSDDFCINACRAYFQLNNGLTCGNPSSPNVIRAFSLNFGEEATGIISIENGKLKIEDDNWYSLDGRKLSGKPTAKGLYIHGGVKVVIP